MIAQCSPAMLLSGPVRHKQRGFDQACSPAWDGWEQVQPVPQSSIPLLFCGDIYMPTGWRVLVTDYACVSTGSRKVQHIWSVEGIAPTWHLAGDRSGAGFKHLPQTGMAGRCVQNVEN